MLRHQLGQDLVLGLHLLLQELNPFLLLLRLAARTFRRLEGGCAVLEELFLPAVELLQPIRNVVRNIRLPDVHKMLKFIERQQAYTAALEEFSQADALAYSIPTRPKRITELIQEGFGETLHGWPGGHLGNEHGDFETPLVVNPRMQAGEVRNDGGLSERLDAAPNSAPGSPRPAGPSVTLHPRMF